MGKVRVARAFEGQQANLGTVAVGDHEVVVTCEWGEGVH